MQTTGDLCTFSQQNQESSAGQGYLVANPPHSFLFFQRHPENTFKMDESSVGVGKVDCTGHSSHRTYIAVQGRFLRQHCKTSGLHQSRCNLYYATFPSHMNIGINSHILIMYKQNKCSLFLTCVVFIKNSHSVEVGCY